MVDSTYESTGVIQIYNIWSQDYPHYFLNFVIMLMSN